MIELMPMTEAEYQSYLRYSIENFANEKAKSEGYSSKDALELANASFSALLPQGLKSPDQHLFSIFDNASQQNIGIMWFAHKKGPPHEHAFIYDFEIHENMRGKGLGAKALASLDKMLISMGIKTVKLHVFGHNKTAYSLYKKMGFHTTNLNMSKSL